MHNQRHSGTISCIALYMGGSHSWSSARHWKCRRAPALVGSNPTPPAIFVFCVPQYPLWLDSCTPQRHETHKESAYLRVFCVPYSKLLCGKPFHFFQIPRTKRITFAPVSCTHLFIRVSIVGCVATWSSGNVAA